MESNFQPWRLVAFATVLLTPVVAFPIRWWLLRATKNGPAQREIFVWAVFAAVSVFFALIYLGGWLISPR